MTAAIPMTLLLGTMALGQAEIPTLRPQDLTSRPDLVGRAVVVDARVERFDYQKDRGWSQFRFQGSPVLFRLPPSLSFPAPPPAKVARAQGILRQDGNRHAVDVTSIQLYISDLERVDKAVAALAPGDHRNREAWSSWAERRAEQYDDATLRGRSRELAGEAIRIQADSPEFRNSPDRQLELARKARAREVPEWITASLTHRALRRIFPGVEEAAEAERLAALAAELLPPHALAPQATDISSWLAAYEEDPAAAYRRAGPEARAAMDRRLFVDATRQALELIVAEQPARALALAMRAEKEIPDDPALARRLRQQGLEATDVSALRLAEVQERARAYESIGQPEAGRDLIRRWLDDQRIHRLSPTDAEGRLLLAQQYESLLGDRERALELLRESWAIDPNSEAISQAFRRRGYRLSATGSWVSAGRADPTRTASAPSDDAALDLPATRGSGDPYQGMTRREVIQLLGTPTRVSRLAVQGRIGEQWFYEAQDVKGNLYIHFEMRPGFRAAVATSSHRHKP